MREVVFDTETTGLKPEDGERIIEIGAVELENGFPTGQSFHVYLNPEGRSVHPEALEVHGIEDDFLKDKPTFAKIAEEFLAFVSDANLVAHNASFDMRFINAELARMDHAPFPDDRVIDTLALARRRHPMGPNSLDALCSRYGIDNAHRTKHGALLDSELLAEVYIELNGGRQAALGLDAQAQQNNTAHSGGTESGKRQPRPKPLPSRLSDEDLARHRAFVAGLTEEPIWDLYSKAGKG